MLKVSEIHSDAAIVRHSKEHVARSRDAFFLMCLQLEDSCVFHQMGRETPLKHGDFALFDTTLPFDAITSGSHGLLVFAIPHRILKRHIADPAAILGVRMRGDAELSGVVSQFIRGFWREYRNRPDATLLPRITTSALELLASVCSQLPQAKLQSSSSAAIWRARVVTYIANHLDDHDLSPPRIADALGISTRHLHYVFDDGEESVAQYIQRLRLEQCARDLVDPAHASSTVLEIALRRGFNNPSHFGRLFRTRYGVTPRCYRLGSGSSHTFGRRPQ
jgi:AraC-like DNA-binding protein